VRFEVLTAATVKIIVLWNEMPCSLVQNNVGNVIRTILRHISEGSNLLSYNASSDVIIASEGFIEQKVFRLKMTFLWDVTSWRLVGKYEHLGGTSHPHLQGRRMETLEMENSRFL
jgi:hypothetical protein